MENEHKSQPEVWVDFCDQMVVENANRKSEDTEAVAGLEVVAAMFNAGR